VRVLLEAGADPSLQTKSVVPSSLCYPPVLTIFLKWQGKTALDLATAKKIIALLKTSVQVLLSTFTFFDSGLLTLFRSPPNQSFLRRRSNIMILLQGCFPSSLRWLKDPSFSLQSSQERAREQRFIVAENSSWRREFRFQQTVEWGMMILSARLLLPLL
jgi:hypothetical protein